MATTTTRPVFTGFAKRVNDALREVVLTCPDKRLAIEHFFDEECKALHARDHDSLTPAEKARRNRLWDDALKRFEWAVEAKHGSL